MDFIRYPWKFCEEHHIKMWLREIRSAVWVAVVPTAAGTSVKTEGIVWTRVIRPSSCNGVTEGIPVARLGNHQTLSETGFYSLKFYPLISRCSNAKIPENHWFSGILWTYERKSALAELQEPGAALCQLTFWRGHMLSTDAAKVIPPEGSKMWEKALLEII